MSSTNNYYIHIEYKFLKTKEYDINTLYWVYIFLEFLLIFANLVYHPQKMNITIYRNDSKIYHKELEYFHELNNIGDYHSYISNINDFIMNSINDAINHIIDENNEIYDTINCSQEL